MPHTNYDPVEVAALNAEALDGVVADALAAFAAAGDLDELKTARLAHAGDRSPLALANREIGALPPQARRRGRQAGRRGPRRGQRRRSTPAQAELEAERDARVLVEEAVDVTLPVRPPPAGARHPLTTLQERIGDVFVAMGWEVAEGPEVEAEWFNFDALNFAPDHPARTMQDTFFVEPAGRRGMVLRTHTSPVQVRAHARRASRRSTSSARARCSAPTSSTPRTRPVFHQIEGLVVDKGITMAHLQGHARPLRRGDVRRGHRAPGCGRTTSRSPSRRAEVDLQCFVCHGASVGNPDRPCRTCSSEGWIEWGGCGMVNPRVLRRLRHRPRASTAASPSAWASSAR